MYFAMSANGTMTMADRSAISVRMAAYTKAVDEIRQDGQYRRDLQKVVSLCSRKCREGFEQSFRFEAR